MIGRRRRPLPRTRLENPPAGYPVREAIVRNTGNTLTLGDGTTLAAGDIAVVNLADPVVTVELMLGRLDRDPALTGLDPIYGPNTRGLELHVGHVDVTDGLRL